MNAHATIGHNGGPELSPYDSIKLHIDDLFETAQGFLDGEPIATQEQADAVSRLLDDARKARLAADSQRKIEAKPFDDGKAAVQALWTPLTDEKKGRCALIAETCKKALTPWEIAKRKKAEEDAAVARKEAEEKAAAARAALQASTDLTAREEAEKALKEAKRADAVANKIERTPTGSKGGARAVSLRSVWRAEVTDFGKLLAHYKATQPERLKEWLQSEADRDVKLPPHTLPGVNAIEDRIAV